MTKIAGSGSGSIGQRHGSADPDPDPDPNVMDPQHWKIGVILFTPAVCSLPESRAESAVAGAPVELESRARASEARLPCSSSLARSCRGHMTCL
jgi:hypothetical protein